MLHMFEKSLWRLLVFTPEQDACFSVTGFLRVCRRLPWGEEIQRDGEGGSHQQPHSHRTHPHETVPSSEEPVHRRLRLVALPVRRTQSHWLGTFRTSVSLLKSRTNPDHHYHEPFGRIRISVGMWAAWQTCKQAPWKPHLWWFANHQKYLRINAGISQTLHVYLLSLGCFRVHYCFNATVIRLLQFPVFSWLTLTWS